MTQPTDTAPETVIVHTHRVKCDGASDVRGGAALGHPLSLIHI